MKNAIETLRDLAYTNRNVEGYAHLMNAVLYLRSQQRRVNG